MRMEGSKGSWAFLALLLLVASCPSSSDGARDDAGGVEAEPAITQADCDEFVHRIFNMVSKRHVH